MGAIFGTGYDDVMVVWGVAFIVGAVGFILGMNGVFQGEERRQNTELATKEDVDPMDHHPLHPAA